MGSGLPRSGRAPVPQALGHEDRLYVVMFGIYVVGWTNLEVPMDDGRSAAGVLEPGPQYHLVIEVFDLYRDVTSDEGAAMRAFIEARDALGLTMYERSTLPLAAIVELISQWPTGRKVIHVSITDERYWVRFKVRGARPFN